MTGDAERSRNFIGRSAVRRKVTELVTAYRFAGNAEDADDCVHFGVR